MIPDKVKEAARSSFIWGEPKEAVLRMLKANGANDEEAESFLKELGKERTREIRGVGLSKIVTGIFLILLPLVSWFIFHSAKIYLPKIFGFAVAAGLYGIWKLVDGVILLVAPKSEKGDLANLDE